MYHFVPWNHISWLMLDRRMISENVQTLWLNHDCLSSDKQQSLTFQDPIMIQSSDKQQSITFQHPIMIQSWPMLDRRMVSENVQTLLEHWCRFWQTFLMFLCLSISRALSEHREHGYTVRIPYADFPVEWDSPVKAGPFGRNVFTIYALSYPTILW